MLIGIPVRINADLLFVLAKMGHGDKIVIADANFPSDSTATSCVHKEVIRVSGKTSEVLDDILKLIPLDQYVDYSVAVMDRVESDKEKDLHVPAYDAIAKSILNSHINDAKMEYVERFNFYDRARECFAVIQTDDTSLYANVIIGKGVVG